MSGSSENTGAHYGSTAYDPARHENQIVAVYDDRSRANAARDALIGAGIPERAIKVLDRTATDSSASTSDDTRHEGFWGALKSLFVPEEDIHAYSHAIGRGHAMLVVTPDSSMNRDRIVEVLESTAPIDFDSKLAEWRQAGYEYPSRPGASGLGSGTDAGRSTVTQGAMPAGTVTAASAGAETGRSDTGETIKVMEERLRIGKREVAKGAVRVRSYVVERPVEEQVRLHDEQVRIERKPVDRPASPGDAGLFQERMIEARATSEEAVVHKEARVVEEIGLRKEAAERTETVRDTVRKTEVDIDDQIKSDPRAGGNATNATPGAGSSGANSPKRT